MSKKKFAIGILTALFILMVIFTAVYNQATGAQIDPEQMRIVMFLPVLFQQCRVGENCAVVVPTAQPECDLKYWWECP